ncbi:MAG: NFACT family protein, partial [Oscillospiraceae bacterium]|nr:NFACT family protein [Oscillospiraceae bacterium]
MWQGKPEASYLRRSGNGRIQLSSASFENPKEPPMFCMLLRKYLVGGRIVSLEQAEWE